MKDKIMRLLINVLVLSNPIGRAICEEAASYNRGIGFAMAKDLMDSDGLHSYHVDEYWDYIRTKAHDDRDMRNMLLGFNTYYKKKH